MAQQRRRANRSEVQLVTVVKAFLSCLLIGGVAIGYVLQSHENTRLQKELGKLEAELRQLKAESNRLGHQLADLHAPANIERMVVAHGLDLVRVRPGQVVQLGAPGSELPMMAQQASPLSRSSSSGRVP
jgi:cell division protein FtsB